MCAAANSTRKTGRPAMPQASVPTSLCILKPATQLTGYDPDD